MAHLSEQHLLLAIHSEIIARDAYAALGTKIEVADGRSAMAILSDEEERHRMTLAARYQNLFGRAYEYDPGLKAGPDFGFLNDSVFGYTQALDALKLALSAEIDSARFYEELLSDATEKPDKKMLKGLARFEKQHQKKLQKEIRKLEDSNHWHLT